MLVYDALYSLYQAESFIQNVTAAFVSGGDVDDAITQVIGGLSDAQNSLSAIDLS